MDVQGKILSFLQVTGPTLPTKVAKNIKTDILIASAHLSDLVSQRKVKISALKIGGSPLYFLPGQEDKLFPFAAGNVKSKDLEVLEKLKEKKVLREGSLELLAKVALRSLKDFAIPMSVTLQGKKELFWRWHTLSEEETKQALRGYFQPTVTVFKTVPEKPPLKEEKPEPKVEPKPEPELKPEVKEEPKPEVKPEQKPTAEPEVVKEKTPSTKIKEEQKTLTEKEKNPLEKNKPILKKLKEKLSHRKRKVIPDLFSPEVENFFKKLKIIIEQKDVIRKNAEINFLVKVPSTFGTITYYCKAKSKKRCDEKDLSSAYMEAQIKKMPLLFLYTETINKKAEEMLESGAFENVIIQKIE